MWLIELILYLALFLFVLFHALTYSIRWYEEAKRRGEEHSLWEFPPRLILPILAEMLCHALMLILTAADLAIGLARRAWNRWAPSPGAEGSQKADPFPPAPTAGRPVILVHGMGMRGLAMWPLALRLRRHGKTVHLFTYGPLRESVEGYARQLHDFAEGLRRERGHEDFDVAAHSLGGLVARRCMQMYEGSHRIRRLVTLGAPHGGSELWRFSILPAGRQLRPGGELIRALNEAGLPPGVEAWAIASDFDELVVPNASARWEAPGVTNIAVENLGHARMLFSGEVCAHVRKALA
ncbi:MAG: alpha/beta fold hydrolase [Nitrospinota bacterium]